MKKPKFKGIKKGYAAIFLGEPVKRRSGLRTFPRMRILYSSGDWTWIYIDSTDPHFLNEDNYCAPCWNSFKSKHNRNSIKALQRYDKNTYKETIFLGYVKE